MILSRFSVNSRLWRRRLCRFLVFLILPALVFALQHLSGTFHSGFGEGAGDSGDESAHYVTGRMVSAYLESGFRSPPLQFAEQYYIHRPEVAVGHWPPAFYFMQSVWAFFFGGSRAAQVAMIGFMAALVGVLILGRLEKEFGWILAASAAILWVCAPLVQQQDTVLMAEIPVALLAYLSVAGFTWFLEEPCWRSAFAFALTAALAALTKGNGFALVLVPPIGAALCRRVSLLFRREFVVACLVGAVLAGIWYIPTRHLITGTFQTLGGLAYAKAAAGPNLRFLVGSIGVGTSLFAAAGLWAQVSRKLPSSVLPRWAASAALILGVLLFHTFVNASVDPRHLVTAVPALLEFTVAGIACLADMQPYIPRRLASAVLALLVLVYSCLNNR